MNILLVFPSSRVAGWGSSRIGGNLDGCFRPNGITMIGSMLRSAGHTVTALDFREYGGWGDVIVKFLSDKWDVICIGWLSAETPNAEQFIKTVREYDKDVYIICGGIHLTVSGIKEMEGVDTIIHGEGDYAILEAIKERAPYIYSMPVQNLDDLPFPDRTLFSPYEKTTAFLPLLELPFASVMFGRGCPYGTVRVEKLEDGTTRDSGCKYCLSGDAVVNTIYGDIPIKKLAEEYSTVPVYTYNRKSREVEIANATHIKKYIENATLCRVHFDDNTYIDCTLDHRFLTFFQNKHGYNELEVQAQHLKPGTRIVSMYFKTNRNRRYREVVCNGSKKREHRIIVEYKIGRKLKKDEHVHHLDCNPFNNDPKNLQNIDRMSHLRIHKKGVKFSIEHKQKLADSKWGDRNPNFKYGMQQKKCLHCGDEFIRGGYRRDQKYCSKKCGGLNRKYKTTFSEPVVIKSCIICNKEIPVNIMKRKPLRKFCNRICYDTARKDQCFVNHKVVRVEMLDKKNDAYCLTVDGYNWFFANNVLVSNCYRSSFSQSFNKHRNHSPERCVMDLLKIKADYGELGSYMIHDDIFPLSDDWVKRFIECYDSHIKERIPFWCQMRADQINRFESKGLMGELARIGLTWTSLGYEIGSARLLEFIGKGVTVEENDRSVDVLHSHNINIFLNYIRHLPTETMEDIKITVDKLKQFRPSYHAASTYTDYPGTVMNKYCKDNNLLLEEHYSTLRYPYEPRIKNVDYDGEGHELWVSALGFKREPMVWQPKS